MTAADSIDRARAIWWRRWILHPVREQLVRGSSPDRLAWTIACGVGLGIFPIMGTTSLLCFLVGWLCRLNQPVLHLFKSLVYPLHLGLILVFIRLGQQMNGVAPIEFSIAEMMQRFRENPARFAGDFGMAALHGVEAWLLVAPLLTLAIRSLVLPLLKASAAGLEKRREADR